MSRKMLISALIITIIFTFNMLICADPSDTSSKKDDVPVFELVKNLDGIKTFDKDQAISAKSKEGTIVSLSHYWFKVNEEKSIIAKKRNTDSTSEESGEWRLVASDESTVGASGIYAKQISLKVGKNKVVLKIKDKDGNRRSMTLDMGLMDKEELTELINNIILKDVDKK